MTLTITVERTFERALRKLPPDRQDAAIEMLERFAETPLLPRLDLRPLRSWPDHFLINARRGDRIILRKDGDDLYAVVDVGPHDNVLKRWNRR